MPSSPPQELRHASDTTGYGSVTPLQDASSQGTASTAAMENPELPTVSSTQSACPGSSREAARPRKKYKNYKSTIYSDTPAPKPRGRPPAVRTQPNVISEADFAWLLGVVSDHDEKKKSGGNVGRFYALLNTRLAHLEERVLNNYIKQARHRLELKQRQEQKTRDEKTRVRREAEEAKARLAHEVEAKKKLAADASALAEENTKLVAQCKSLEEAVEARDAAVAKAKQDLEEQRKRAVEEASSSYTSMIKELKTKIQEQDQQVETQQETLMRQEQASRTLREQISGSTMAEKEFIAAKEKLAKAETANLELSQVLGPKLKELSRLKTQLQVAEATLARQQHQHRAQLEQSEMQLRVAEEQRDEAFASLNLFSRASMVEFELKKLKMAASCAYNEDARFKNRAKSPFEDGPFWNNASMADMAVRVTEARGADAVQLNRFRKLFKRWREVRNDISHTPHGYTKYVAEANELKRDMDALCLAVAPAIIAMSDSSGTELLSSVVSYVRAKQQEFSKKRVRG